jgi:5'-3' exonuclease
MRSSETVWDLRIDGDVVVYRAGYAADSRGGDLSHSLHNVKLIINSIKNKFDPCTLKVYLSNPDPKVNFRTQIYPEYKANRKDIAKPKHYNEIRKYMISRGAIVVDWGECDDALCSDVKDNTVIASIDKDLRMTPCYHYIINRDDLIKVVQPGTLQLIKKTDTKGRVKYVLEGTGLKFFMAQMLMGDKIDNIKAPVKGLGPIKIYKMFKDRSLLEMWKLINKIYMDSNLHLYTNAQLLWIAQTKNQVWRHEAFLCEIEKHG